MRDDYPRSLEILEIEKEAKDLFTIFVKNTLGGFVPGQFVMMWIPRVDEKPFGVSYLEKDQIGITFEVKGKFTKKLASIKKAGIIGIRGPYGIGFPEPDSSTIVIGGGCGVSSLAPLMEKVKKSNSIIGARSKDMLLFRNRFKDAHFTTDDGTFGKKGFVTEILEEKLSAPDKVSQVFCCGPEIMMSRVIEICKKHRKKCFISMERYMKCGFGVCGQCMCGDKVVCKEGPVFESKDVEGNPEFNHFARIKSGKKVPVSDYVRWRSCE